MELDSTTGNFYYLFLIIVNIIIEEQAEQLVSSFKKLVDPNEMGLLLYTVIIIIIK